MTETAEEETLKQILTNLCRHLGDVTEQLSGIEFQLDQFNEKMDMIIGESRDGSHGWVRTLDVGD